MTLTPGHPYGAVYDPDQNTVVFYADASKMPEGDITNRFRVRQSFDGGTDNIEVTTTDGYSWINFEHPTMISPIAAVILFAQTMSSMLEAQGSEPEEAEIVVLDEVET